MEGDSNTRMSGLEMLIVFIYLLQGSPTKLEPVDKDMWSKLAAGSRDPVFYRLDFPVSSPLPTIKSITVNQNVICTGPKPSKHWSIPNMLHSVLSRPHSWPHSVRSFNQNCMQGELRRNSKEHLGNSLS
jgi:hypothetical protein